MERELRRMQGGRWRVDLIAGRYGWYARAIRLQTSCASSIPLGAATSGVPSMASGYSKILPS